MRPLLPTAALLLTSPAAASGLSTDIGLAPTSAAAPSVGPIGLSERAAPGSFRVGLATDAVHRPMNQYRCEDAGGARCSQAAGVVVGGRVVAVGSLAVAVSRRTWVEAHVPAAAHWGGDVADLSPSGVALGDPRLGVRTRLLSRATTLDAYGDLSAPVGTPGVWFGDRYPTAHGGVVTTHTAGLFTALLDVGALLRAPLSANEWSLRLGPSLLVDAGALIALSERVQLWTVASARVSQGEPALVALGGAAVHLSPSLRAEVGAGRAVLTAPGAGPLHVRASITLTRARPERALPPEDPVLPPAPDVWLPDQAFRVRDERVELRQGIAFLPESTLISPRSYPTVRSLAEWVVAHPEHGQILIAAYASSAASSAANYSLSLGRAQSVSDALVAAGVARGRLSYKGMGMLSPDEDPGEHQVFINGHPEAHLTLTLPDTVDAAPDEALDFEVWLRERADP